MLPKTLRLPPFSSHAFRLSNRPAHILGYRTTYVLWGYTKYALLYKLPRPDNAHALATLNRPSTRLRSYSGGAAVADQ